MVAFAICIHARRAFASVETVESISALTHGSPVVPLSIQETLDCSYSYGGILYSCYGGDTCAAFDWMNEVCALLSQLMSGTYRCVGGSSVLYNGLMTKICPGPSTVRPNIVGLVPEKHSDFGSQKACYVRR